MFRACMSLLVATVIVILLGPPLLLIGLIHPAPRLVNWASWFWARSVLRTLGVRLRVEGLSRTIAETPCFFVGNHQSALDIPLLIMALYGNVRFMAKDTLFRIPIFGWVLSRYGYVPIKRGSPRTTAAAIDDMILRLKRRPISTVVFPEGTRSPDGELLPFHQGTMKICGRAELPVVPFSIDGSRALHQRGTLHARPGEVRLRFAKPISVGEVAAMTSLELMHRVRAQIESGLTRHQIGATVLPTPCIVT